MICLFSPTIGEQPKQRKLVICSGNGESGWRSKGLNIPRFSAVLYGGPESLPLWGLWGANSWLEATAYLQEILLNFFLLCFHHLSSSSNRISHSLLAGSLFPEESGQCGKGYCSAHSGHKCSKVWLEDYQLLVRGSEGCSWFCLNLLWEGTSPDTSLRPPFCCLANGTHRSSTKLHNMTLINMEGKCFFKFKCFSYVKSV